MATLFDRTGFNFTDTSGIITTLPNTAVQQMNTIPSLVPNQWMRDDLINNDTTGYYKNPVGPSCNTIWLSANTLINTTSSVTGSGNLTALWTTINTDFKSIAGYSVTTGDAENPPIVTTQVPGQIVQFINHTNRISGVVPITANTDAAQKPHLEQAMQIGRALTYIIFQVDGREDNAPMLGSFTSILIANTINDYANIVVTYANTINNSITITTETVGEDVITTKVSNLSYAAVNSIATVANTLNTLFLERRIHDENFYTTSNELVNEAKNIRKYENLGASEDSLVQNLIGTDKLKSRIANQ
jgi:uncharacterized membrane protein affecting hemolysin expression